MRGSRFGVPAIFSLCAIIGTGVAACSLSGGTIPELGVGTDAAVSDANPDDAVSPQDGGRPPTDGGPTGDADAAQPFDAACGTTFSAGTMTAFHSTQAKTIDGLDTDWGCEAPFDLTSGDATQKHSNSPDAGYDMSGACKFEWSPIAVYVFCDVVDPTPGDGTSPNLTANDAVEVYISGTPTASRTGNYGLFDHQYVVDWRGHTTEYANGTQLSGPPAGFTAAVATHTGGYSIEASVSDVALLSGSSLGDSMTLGFDFAIDNGVGQEEAIVWTQGTHGACGSCTSGCCCSGTNGPASIDYAYCDALAFGAITLRP